jgi:hypothetical protein
MRDVDRLRCDVCGRFIGPKDTEARTYTYYGSWATMQPPDPIYECGKCWGKRSQEEVKRLDNACWMKPVKAFTPDPLPKEA